MRRKTMVGVSIDTDIANTLAGYAEKHDMSLSSVYNKVLRRSIGMLAGYRLQKWDGETKSWVTLPDR